MHLIGILDDWSLCAGAAARSLVTHLERSKRCSESPFNEAHFTRFIVVTPEYGLEILGHLVSYCILNDSQNVFFIFCFFPANFLL